MDQASVNGHGIYNCQLYLLSLQILSTLTPQARRLHAYAAERRRHEALLAAFEHNQQALGVAQRSYQEGVADYLTVLIAQRSVLASQTVLAESRTAASVALVALYKALGGGWDPSSIVEVLEPISDAGLARSNAQP